MPNYKELHGEGDYSYEINETGITGTRTFLQSDNGAVTTLPVIGDSMVDPAGATVTACKLRSIRSVFHDGHGDSMKLVFSYSTAAGASAGGSRVPRNAADRQFNGGVEVNVISGSAAVTAYGGSDPVNGEFPKRIPVGSFTVPKIGMTAAQKATWFSTHFLPKVGMINAATFEGFRAGSVLFESISGGNATDDEGNEVWNFTCNFMWRYVPELAGEDWQYTRDAKTGGWVKPWINGAPIYGTFSSSGMF